ncbi:MAG: hypothetical protein JW929_08115 [Anaerolineales bacterium]|nr:hypothetical protein [Anaerolineales bacterium]
MTVPKDILSAGEKNAAGAAELRRAIGALGLDPAGRILPFAVFSLPAGPGAKVTDRGIWAGRNGKLVTLVVCPPSSILPQLRRQTLKRSTKVLTQMGEVRRGI